ncbi:MAG: 2-amino-4-hydroxy-6-hydroxymethyldihydropteridine diphosphokinase [Clostridium sp.]|nr:2-amino-4-hydroxy-6-hydroxymethyldihydropteridine diphosphokinase [Clostridium sp.]
MDEIRIEGLEVYAYHGVFPEENKNGQHFYLNAVLYTDTRKAGRTDELADSTHYGLVCEEMARAMKEQCFHLLERAAEYVAERVLTVFPLIKEIELEICKPEAPIALPFSNVSVKIRRGWHTVSLGLGSNLGDSERYLRDALQKLSSAKEIRNVKSSSLIRTKPYGVLDQPDFLNGAAVLETLLTPLELLDFLHKLEAEAGRVRKEHWGARTLDLDILFYDDWIIDSERLTVPHADMANREFVLAPLAELNPYFRHPLTGKTVREMLAQLRQESAQNRT